MTNPYDIKCLEAAASVLVISCFMLNFQRPSENTFLSNASRFSKKSIAFSEIGFQTSTFCPSGKVEISIEHWRNDADKGTSKCSEQNLFQCHFFPPLISHTGLASTQGFRGKRPAEVWRCL
jgi:hypothetical protein